MKRAPVSAIRRDERAAQLQSELDRHGRIAERILRAAEHRDSHEERLEVLAAYARAGQRRALRRAVRALARDKTGAPLDDDDKRILNSEFSQVGNAILRRLMQREAPEVIAAKPDLPWEWSYQHAYEELSAAPCLRRIGLLDHAEMRAAIDAHDFPSAQLWKTSRFARSLKSADGDPKKADDPRWAYFAALLDHIVGPVRTGAKTQLPGNSLRVTWSNWNFRKWSERRRRTARSTRGPTDT